RALPVGLDTAAKADPVRYRYLVPTVTAVPRAGTTWLANAEIGPARMVVPATTAARDQPVIGDVDAPHFLRRPDAVDFWPSFRPQPFTPGVPSRKRRIAWSEPFLTSSRAWKQSAFELSDRPILFETPRFGARRHLGVGLMGPGDRVEVCLLFWRPAGAGKHK